MTHLKVILKPWAQGQSSRTHVPPPKSPHRMRVTRLGAGNGGVGGRKTGPLSEEGVRVTQIPSETNPLGLQV